MVDCTTAGGCTVCRRGWRHKKKAAHACTAKFREETSKKADSATLRRIAAMHNVGRPAFVRKRNFAVQHRISLDRRAAGE